MGIKPVMYIFLDGFFHGTSKGNITVIQASMFDKNLLHNRSKECSI